MKIRVAKDRDKVLAFLDDLNQICIKHDLQPYAGPDGCMMIIEWEPEIMRDTRFEIEDVRKHNQ